MNIFGDPLTVEQITALRLAAGGQQKFEDTAAFKVLMFCPIPLVDVLAAAATYAVESSVTPDYSKPLRYHAGSAGMVWPTGSIAEAYARKVSAQGRDLIAAEVAALKKAAEAEMIAKVAVTAGAKLIGDSVANISL